MFPYQRLDIISIVLLIIIALLTAFSAYEKWCNRPGQDEDKK